MRGSFLSNGVSYRWYHLKSTARPSPTCPTMVDLIPCSARSLFVSYTSCGSLDTGTLAHSQQCTGTCYGAETNQTSVVQHRSPGSSCNDENSAIFRFSHISFACSSVEANSNRLLAYFFTILSIASAAFKITSGVPCIFKNRESCVGYGFCVVPALLIAFITVVPLQPKEKGKLICTHCYHPIIRHILDRR